MNTLTAWSPSVIMALGILFMLGLDSQHAMPLAHPLDSTVPMQLSGFAGRNLPMSAEEIRVAAPTSYLMRSYEDTLSTGEHGAFSLYIGYYDSQTQGKTIHSPKNCLPGAGWEALTSNVVSINTGAGPVAVNRYVLQNVNTKSRALVLYWYQGRGRIQANEYKVKWDLLRDAALRRRSEEALVRIVVPIQESEDQAYDIAVAVASLVAPALDNALPA